MGGYGPTLIMVSLISLLWLRTAHVSGETVTVHQTLNISDSCSFPNPLKVKVIRDKEDDVTLSLITNRIIHVPQRVVLMKADENTEETIYETVEIPQSNVAYHNYDNGACFVAHCIKHKDSNVAFYTINGTLLIHGDMFHLYPERTEARFGSHDVTQDYVMELVDVSGGPRNSDYVEAPDNDALKLNLANRRKSNTGSTQDATEYFIDVFPVVDYYLYTRWLTRNNNDQAQALSAITSYLTNIFTGVVLRYTTLRLSGQRQLTVQMVTPFISTDASTSWFTEDHVIDLGGGRHFVDIHDQLDSFSEWVKENNAIPHNDHAMLFSGYEFYSDHVYSSRDILGIAWLNKVCIKDEGKSSSIVKDRMGYQTEGTAAHELGHSLGAGHDGIDNFCSASDQYVMTAYVAARLVDHNMHNTFKFSACTSDEISSYISLLEPTDYLDTCLLASSGTTMPDTPPTPHRIDQLCPSLYEHGSSLCWGGSEHPLTARYVCTSMFCEDDEGECHHVIPPSGTCCGNGKFCVQGMCTPAPAGTCVLDDKCPFNDQPSCETKIGSDMSKCFDKLADTYCCDRCKDRMDYAQVPDHPPSIVLILGDPSQPDYLNIIDNQVVSLGLGVGIPFICSVNGGVPEVSTVTLDCGAPGLFNQTVSGSSMINLLRTELSYNNTECVCSAAHVTGLYNQTTSFVINIMVFPPPDPPKMYVNNVLVVNNQDSTLAMGVSYDVMCEVLGGAPRVSSVSIACDGFDVLTDPSYRAIMRDVLASPDINNTKCVCSADHYTGQYILTTSILLVVIADVPPNPPVLTVDHEIVTRLELVYWRSARVRCTVNGGNPEVESVSLTCGGHLIDNDSGNYLYTYIRGVTSLHQQECVCSADHITGLYDKTSSFTVIITYIVPDDPPIIVVNGDELVPNQIVTYDFNKTLNMECFVYGGGPEVHQVNISCGGIDVGQSLGDSNRAAFDVTSDFDQAECVCSADHITGQYNLTTSMIINIRKSPPQDDPKLTVNGGSPITDNDDIRVRLAGTLDIICVVDGGYPDVTNVMVSCTGTMDNMTDPGTSLTRQVVVTRDLDQARCVCTADHVTGKYWNTMAFSVHVLDPPSLNGFSIDSKSDPSHDIEVTAGERIVFMCQAYGMPAPEVTITREPIGRRLRGVTSPSNSDAYTNVFTGESIISCTDRGQYRCLAGNKIDEVVYKYLSIHVLCPPHMDETAATIPVARLGAMGLADISLKVKSDPEVTDFRLSKHKRQEFYEPNVRFVRDFDSSEYMTRVNYDDLVNEVTLSLFDPDPCQDCFYTLTLINGVEPSLNVSFNATFASDVTGTKHGMVSAVGSGVGMYAVSTVAGLLIVTMAICMAVYVKVYRMDTSFISKG